MDGELTESLGMISCFSAVFFTLLFLLLLFNVKFFPLVFIVLQILKCLG